MAIIDNLVNYWKCDEASGDLVDVHGASTLTDTNTVGATTGIINGSRIFVSGNSEYFIKASTAELQHGDIDFAFSFWVQLTTKAALQTIFAKDLGAINRELIVFYEDSPVDRFSFNVFPSNVYTAVKSNAHGSPSTGVTYHIFCWHDATANEIGITINDTYTDTVTGLSTLAAAGSASFYIGAYAPTGTPGFFADMWMDEIARWKGRVPSTTERTQLYNGGAGLAYPFTTGRTTRNTRAFPLGEAVGMGFAMTR